MPETPKLVEAVARAVCAVMGRNPDGQMGLSFSGRPVLNWESFADAARAALDAIRNYSFGDTVILVNGTDPVATLKGDLPGTILRALIDLAMTEGGEHGQDA